MMKAHKAQCKKYPQASETNKQRAFINTTNKSFPVATAYLHENLDLPTKNSVDL